MPLSNGDLTKEEKQQIIDAKKKIPQIKSMIAKAKKAGIDTSAMEIQLTDLEKKIQGLHDVYVSPKTTGM